MVTRKAATAGSEGAMKVLAIGCSSLGYCLARWGNSRQRAPIEHMPCAIGKRPTLVALAAALARAVGAAAATVVVADTGGACGEGD